MFMIIIVNQYTIMFVFKLILNILQVPWYASCGGAVYGDGNLVFIANDWHTALLPVYLKAYYRDNGLMQYARSVLVIHNIAHQVLHLNLSMPLFSHQKFEYLTQ